MNRRYFLRLTGACLLLTSQLMESPASGEQNVLERGAYLVNVLAACASCHTPRGGGPALSGGNRFGTSDRYVYAPNITSDMETGIGRWSDQQITDAIRNGHGPDGTRIEPPMPQTAYRRISDNDLAAIVAFLRSVPPIRNKVQRVERSQPADDPMQLHVISVREPDLDDELERGAYIANALAHCTECHTNASALSPEFAAHLNQGGKRFRSANGVVVAPDITMSSLARYTDDELTALITRGIRPDGSRLEGPMPVGSYAAMKPEDVKAVIAYLRH